MVGRKEPPAWFSSWPRHTGSVESIHSLGHLWSEGLGLVVFQAAPLSQRISSMGKLSDQSYLDLHILFGKTYL